MAEAEHDLRDAPHLDLLRALGNAIAAMVPKDVFEWFVSRITNCPMHLHRTIGGVAN